MKNPTARVARQGLDWKCFPATSKPDNATEAPVVSIDIVALLAARSGVAAATVKAHLTAFGMEARS